MPWRGEAGGPEGREQPRLELSEPLLSRLGRGKASWRTNRSFCFGELNKRAAEADARLKRLCDAIESGAADLNGPDLRDRIASLKATRDQAQVDAERAQATLQGSGQAITPAMLAKFGRMARERMRVDGGGYRRDHLRALAQRVEVADTEVRIMGSKSNLLGTSVAAAGGKSATHGVRSFVLK